MDSCPACKVGTMEAQIIEAVFKQHRRWIAIRGVPALVCDTCGETTYPNESVVRIQAIVGGEEAPTDFSWTPQFDFEASASRPTFVTSTSVLNSDTIRRVPIEPPILPRATTAVEAINAA